MAYDIIKDVMGCREFYVEKQLNCDGEISTDTFKVNNVYHAFGGFEDKATTIIMPAADTYTKVTNATGDLFEGMESNGLTLNDDEITFLNGGDYTGKLAISVSGSQGKDYHFRIYNLTQAKVMGYEMGISTSGAGNNVVLSIPLYLEVNTNDVLQVQVKSADGSSAILSDSIFYISYLHE